MTSPTSAGVAIVTGGGSGIGKATVELLLARGGAVVAVDREAEALASLSAHERLATVAGDVGEASTYDDAVRLAAGFGPLDRVVLNAGIKMSGGLEEVSLDGLRRAFEVNVVAVAQGIWSVLPALRATGGGAIVVTSSISGKGGDPTRWAYGTTKAAVINLVESAALALASEGIRVNAVCPGPILTGMTRPTLAREPERAEGIRAGVPMRRMGEAEEVATAIAFLASPDASFITGVALDVDGGMQAMNGNYRVPNDA